MADWATPAPSRSSSAPTQMVEPNTPLHPSDFDKLYADHFSFVWRSLHALGVGASHLADAAQDTFLVVHRRLPEFEGRAHPRTWLFAIVQHVAFNYRRAERRKLAPLRPLDVTQPSDAPDPAERTAEAEAARFLQAFISSLDDGKRAVFALALIEQLPAPEVAAILGIPENTVYSRIRLVRKAFRDEALRYQEEKP
jgi:RNA polymerase sigma-70 factor, ECF subfamily